MEFCDAAASHILKQPAYGSLLNFQILRIPHRVDGMADCGEYHPALAEVVGPAGDRPGAQVFELQAIDILRLEDDVLWILVVSHVMLLIVHHERTDACRDRMLVLRSTHLKGPQRGVTDIRSAH